MFTQQTLGNFVAVIQLVRSAEEAHKMAAMASVVVSAIVEQGQAVSKRTGHQLAPSVVAASALSANAAALLYSARSTLSEGVMAAQQLFVGTPFHESFCKLCSYFDYGAPNVVAQATVLLEDLLLAAAYWLNEKEEAALPLQQFVVPCYFRVGGDLVMARSPAHARLVAAVAHYECAVEVLTVDALASWNNGVPGTEPQKFELGAVAGWQPAWLNN